MTITPSELDSLDSILRRAEDDWDAYYCSGYRPRDFGNPQEWGSHVCAVNADIRGVRKVIARAQRELGGRS